LPHWETSNASPCRGILAGAYVDAASGGRSPQPGALPLIPHSPSAISRRERYGACVGGPLSGRARPQTYKYAYWCASNSWRLNRREL